MYLGFRRSNTWCTSRWMKWGIRITKETRNFNYIASISEDKVGYLAVDEDRSERMAHADFPDRISSGGFAALALVFHPHMRENFEMTCEGLGNWHGQAAWLVHFKQREDRPALISEYNVGGQIYSLRLKGRAWITADKFEIVRIESELMNPMAQIQLRCEQQVVEYGPVRFQKNVELWLPHEGGNLPRLSQASLLPQPRLRPLHAVFGGFGGKDERTQGADDQAPRKADTPTNLRAGCFLRSPAAGNTACP